jgi:predicted PurR-regulated permease PerM
VVIGVAILLVYAGYSLSIIFTPVMLALLVAYLVHPAVKFVEKRFGVKPSYTVALLLVFNFGVLTGLVMWLGPILSQQVQLLVGAQPAYSMAVTQKLNAWLQSKGVSFQVTDFLNLALSESGRMLGAAGGFVKNFADVSLSFTIWLVCFYTFASRTSQTYSYVARWMPAYLLDDFHEVMAILDRALTGFFRGRIFIALITAFLFGLSWKATGVPFWLLLGILAAVFNIVPYLSILVWFAALLVNYGDALIQNQQIDLINILVWPTVAFAAVQFVEGWVLTPLVQGKEVNLSAATILIAVAVGGIVGGVVGMLIGIPLAAVIKMLGEHYLQRDPS